MSRSPKKPEHTMRATMSILHWVPDLDEIEETLTGGVRPMKGDTVKFGDVNGRSKDR